MTAKERIRKYREVGGAADLVRVEVLVPSDRRDEIVAAAASMREAHRLEKARIGEFLAIAAERYGLRIFDNIDVDKISDMRGKAWIVANALLERGDVRAFTMARRMINALEGVR